MRFGIDSKEKLINHWLLNSDTPTVMAIAETTRDSHDPRGFNFEAKVTVNGVELPFEAFEKFLNDFCESAYNDKVAEFKDLDRAVEERLKKRLKAEAEPLINKMNDVLRKLEDIEDVITPYWEKEKT